MVCRIGCGACCIVISISSPIPGMPAGKRAGVRCAQLTDDNRCRLFGKSERPVVCDAFRADREHCGDTDEQALERLAWLEAVTQ